MSFTVLPLSQPQTGSGSKALTHSNGRVVDMDLGHLFGDSRPTVRDGEAKVMDSKIDPKRVAVMWTRGVLPHEIAEILGMSDVLLDELMRSEAFVLQVQALQATREISSLDKALEATATEALICLRDMMQNSENDSVKTKAAMYLIDQHRGKAPQHIHFDAGKRVEDPKKEIERLRLRTGMAKPTTPPIP